MTNTVNINYELNEHKKKKNMTIIENFIVVIVIENFLQ